MRLIALVFIVLAAIVGVAFVHKRLMVLVLLVGAFTWSLLAR